MLIQKKISTKKLIIYMAIIIVMIGGTGFMLYQNKQLTTRISTKVNAPIVFNNAVPAAAVASEDNTLEMNKINQSAGLNLNIFSSDKFKNLQKDVSAVKGQPEVGKRDPFRPN